MSAAIRERISFIREALGNLRYEIPSIVAMFGLGIVIAREYDVSASTGRLLFAAGLLGGLLHLWLFPRSASPDPRQNPLQPDIDAARKAGYRVWCLYPRSEDTASRSFFALRENGYVLTDRQGRLVDAAAESHDSATMRRKSFRLVEVDED